MGMSLRSTTKKQSFVLSVQVLQNGSPVAAATRPLGRTGDLWISGNDNGPLSIPLYGDRANTNLFHSRRGKTYLELDRFWEGFVVSGGDSVEITRKHRPAGPQLIRPGDYGSLSNEDLTVIFRAGPARKEIHHALLAAYRPGPFTGLIRDRYEIPSILYATLLATLLVGGFGLGLLNHPGLPQMTFETLDHEFNLPFIAPEHFATAPEALQHNLVRSNFTGSVAGFYRAVTKALTGRGNENDRLTFPQTRRISSENYQKMEREIAELRTAQERTTAATLRRPASAMIAIPAHEGMTLSGDIRRLQDKVELFQKGLKKSLEMKRTVSKEFPKDTDYNFDAYRDLKPGKSGLLNEETVAALAKIRPFVEMTDEEAMYFQAFNTAQMARGYQSRLGGAHSNRHDALPPPVGLSSRVVFATYAFNPKLILDDTKAEELIGSSMDPKNIKVQKVVEPLIGEIDPTLVEATIKKYRFELQSCFERALKRDKYARGAMEWRWRIDSNGRMSGLELLKNSIDDPSMASCVRKKMSVWRFPKPRRGSIEITYPFEFHPARG